ncbi:carboxypeptidase-like regulatory domain-containing protein [Posidoniimonas corsicana]|uniref:carboxypeptidase-like regulatory domain-containing protein n=1 Tax=Posidoniimonas corsicana TaxID=1938618 RepID=UPI0018D365EB|nr:carboxypeptidase-like regulatory domain-containing protein [Posidoniimonas corsicana]
MLAAVAAWVDPPPRVTFIAGWASHLRTQLVPDNVCAENDRDALAAGEFFARSTFSSDRNLSADLFHAELQRDSDSDTPRLIYLSGYATRDPDGQVVVMTKEFRPVTGEGGLRLGRLLDQVDESPRPTLLVLDLTWHVANGPAGQLPSGVGDEVYAVLKERRAPNRLTLLSCSPGESTTEITGAGRTTFGLFFEAALRGYADGCNRSGVTDGRVSAAELGEYVCGRVSEWSSRFGSQPQTPRLLADQDIDFLLTVSNRKDEQMTLRAAVAEYPSGLKQVWAERDAMVAGGARAVAPRLLNRLEHEVLEIERRWRRGLPVDSVNAMLARHVPHLQRDISNVLSLVTPRVRLSLASMLADSPSSTDAAEQAWATLLESTNSEPNDVKAKAARAASVAAFRKATAEIDFPRLAEAGISVILQSPADFRERAPLAVDELRRRSSGLQLLEVADLEALASVVASNPSLPSQSAVSMLEVSLLRERAWLNPRVVGWAQQWLADADGASRTAWAGVSEPGYVSVAEIESYTQRAADLYLRAIAVQRSIATGLDARDRALAILPEILPVIRGRSELHVAWDSAAQDAVRLSALLESPPHRTGAEDVFATIEKIAALSGELDLQLSTLLGPMAPEVTDPLRDELASGDWERISTAETLLDTAMLDADRREALCLAVGAAAALLADDLQQLVARRTRSAESPDAWQSEDGFVSRGLAIREARFTARLLEMMACPSPELTATVESTAAQSGPLDQNLMLAHVRAALADARDRIEGDCPLPVRDRASRVLTPGVFVAALDGRQAEPALAVGRAQLDAWRLGNSERLAAAATDIGGVVFAAVASKRLSVESRSGEQLIAVSPLRSNGDHEQRIGLPRLSERERSEELVLRIVGVAPDELDATVLQPASCLAVSQSKDACADGTVLRIAIQLDRNASFADLAATSGVLLRLTDGRRVRHVPIATPGLCTASPVEVYTVVAGVRSKLQSHYELPPSTGPRLVRWIVKNRTTRDLAIKADVHAGSPFSAEAVAPALGEVPLVLTAGGPAPGGTAELDIEKVSVVVSESSSGKVLYQQDATLSVRDPSEYVRVLDARVAPDESGATVATLRAERLPGSPEQVELSWSLSNPHAAAPIVAGGRLHAVLGAANPVATLSATLAPDWSDQPQVLTRLAINGVDRSIVRRARRPAYGMNGTLDVVPSPTILLSAPAMVRSGDGLDYSADAAPVPAGATLELVLGELASDGSVVVDRRRYYNTARKGMVKVQPKVVGGRFAIHPTISGQQGSFATDGIVGRRVLRATVFDGQGDRIAQTLQPIVIDGDPPTSVAVSPTATPVAGKPVEFAVTAVDDLSGVASVSLFVGAAVDGKPPKGAAVVAAVADPQRPGRWVAPLPMPAGVPLAEVTAQVTNGVGLTRELCLPVRLVTAEQASLGRVAGAVTEGVRPQPGLTVELRDPSQQPVASASTNAQGQFLFTGVKPGKYLVWSVKEQSQRVGATGVEVKAGATATAELKLSL